MANPQKNTLKEKIKKTLYKTKIQMKEKFTIMVVPHNQKGVKNLNLPKWIILSVLIAFIGILSFSLVTITKYVYLSIRQGQYLSQNDKMIKELENLIYNSDNLINVQKSFSVSLNTLLKTAGLSEEVVYNENSALGGPFMENQNPAEVDTDNNNSSNDYIFAQIEEIKDLAKMENEIITIDKKINKLAKKLKYFEEITRFIPSIWPILGDGDILNKNENQTKMVISTLPFTPVIATANGKVSGIQFDGSKITVTIRHRYQFISVYSNLYQIDEKIKTDSNIQKGQIIGYVSKNNGKSYLEYSIFIGNKNGLYPVNPHDFTYLGR